MHSTSITKNLSGLKSLIRRHRSRRTARTDSDGEESLLSRLVDVFLRTWDLGFTAFGGPPVHFRIFHQRFVEGKTGEKWVDEQTVSCFFQHLSDFNNFGSANGLVIVSRAVCHMSSASGAGKHENVVLPRVAARWLHSCRSNIFNLEVRISKQ